MRTGVGGRQTVRGGRRAGARLLLVATLASPGARAATDADADAEVSPERLSDPAAPQALGRVFAAGPTAPALVLFSSGGYGYTESVLNTGDVHHRAAGSVGVEGRPLDWLGLGLRLDGRYDKHDGGAQGTDDGWIGDPRLFVRVDRALGPSLRAGGRVGIWFPGAKAPSVDLGATTPELIGALTWSPRAALWLTANGGYRLNRSARSAGDAALLSPNDRLGLELSAFNQALVGVAGAYGAGRAQGFVEVTAELMVGAGSPPLSASPIRAGGGMRFAITPDVRVEGLVEADVGSRPALAMSGPLVPVPPRAAVWLGVGYRFGSETPKKAPPHHPPPVVAPAAPPPAPVTAKLEGRVASADGTAPPEVRVTVRAGAGVEAESVEVDADGRFAFTGKPGQTVTAEAQATGYEPASETVTLAAGDATEVKLTLKRQLPGGQIRGLVRSFKGVGLDAEITVDRSDQASRTLRTQDGHFEVDVAPGTYEVTITAPGYETQRRRVEVEKNGVTVLNVDLRNAR